MKTIMHIDMNAFFASVEQAGNPALKGKPIVVGGGIQKGSVVAAASYEAKAFGVKNGMSTWEARKLCPNLIVVIGNMSKYVKASKIFTSMLVDYSDQVEIFSIDEAFVDITKTAKRFGGKVALAKEIKARIKSKLNLTCSIGISFNKFLAKLAGELEKPDGLVVLAPEDIPNKIKDLPVKKLCGIGAKTEQDLACLGIKTFGQLNQYPRESLVKRFRSAYGEQLWQMGQGYGSTQVSYYYQTSEAKSFSHSYTLPKATTDLVEVKSYLLRLSEQVGRRLRKNRAKGKVVQLSIAFFDFTSWNKQKKLEDFLDDGYKIYQVTEKLLDNYLPRKEAIRFVGVAVNNLIHHIDQLSIFPTEEQRKQALQAMDQINDRYGEFTIERASIMETALQGKVGMVAPQSYGLS